MRFFYIATHIFLLLISSVACSRSDIADKLSRVEELSECDSDSALAIIDSIDPSTLGSESEKAKYALLLTAMKIDNGKVLGNDSLIDIAISYYSKHDATYDQMRALYYKGISNYMKGRLANAIVPATCSRTCDKDRQRLLAGEVHGTPRSNIQLFPEQKGSHKLFQGSRRLLSKDRKDHRTPPRPMLLRRGKERQRAKSRKHRNARQPARARKGRAFRQHTHVVLRQGTSAYVPEFKPQ